MDSLCPISEKTSRKVSHLSWSVKLVSYTLYEPTCVLTLEAYQTEVFRMPDRSRSERSGQLCVNLKTAKSTLRGTVSVVL